MLHPLLFEKNLHTLVWGTELWEVSAVESSPCIVANGSLAGRDLISVVDEYKEQILGDAVYKEYGGKMPLLVKFIDAHQDLSIQVHPDDAMAAKQCGGFGKTEMWYIIDAEPGATLLSGFKEPITPEEYEKRVNDGTICDVLARHEVHPGDVFYIPAGRVHAICGGIYLAEVQQSSDITYRIFDYNRPGLDGKPRELHTKLAAEAIDFNVSADYRTYYGSTISHAARVIDTPFFDIRIIDLHKSFAFPSKDKRNEPRFHRNLIKYDSFVISMCISGSCRVIIRNYEGEEKELYLREGHSCLIPAYLADYDLVPMHPNTRILEAHIDRKDRSPLAKLLRFLKIRKK